MFRAPCLILLTLFSASIEAKVPDAATLAARAERAIKAGDVVPERDLAPLIEALKRTDDEDELRRVIDKVETIGRGDGDSPAAVKRYLLEKATPLLLQIGREAHDTFARGDALTALRNMGASRAVLEEAATIAERDNNDYVKSRGEILRNFIQSMPKQARVDQIKPTDAGREREAIAFLKSRRLGVSSDQLVRSALEGKPDEVQALLDAGVDPNAGRDLTDTALSAATFSGCGNTHGEDDQRARTIALLLAAGADVKRTDDNGNTVLLRAAQMCGPKVIAQLIAAGSPVNATNGSGVNALAMALITKQLDTAELLVAKGARLSAQQRTMVSGSATDARAKAIVERAAAK